jgi:hypothetical protein
MMSVVFIQFFLISRNSHFFFRGAIMQIAVSLFFQMALPVFIGGKYRAAHEALKICSHMRNAAAATFVGILRISRFRHHYMFMVTKFLNGVIKAQKEQQHHDATNNLLDRVIGKNPAQ